MPVFFSFLQIVQTVLHITTKRLLASERKERGQIQVLHEQKATSLDAPGGQVVCFMFK